MISEAAAKSNLKRVSLELGGKSPLVVLADCDGKWSTRDVLANSTVESTRIIPARSHPKCTCYRTRKIPRRFHFTVILATIALSCSQWTRLWRLPTQQSFRTTVRTAVPAPGPLSRMRFMTSLLRRPPPRPVGGRSATRSPKTRSKDRRQVLFFHTRCNYALLVVGHVSISCHWR